MASRRPRQPRRFCRWVQGFVFSLNPHTDRSDQYGRLLRYVIRVNGAVNVNIRLGKRARTRPTTLTTVSRRDAERKGGAMTRHVRAGRVVLAVGAMALGQPRPRPRPRQGRVACEKL
jgi:hypothetical protein